MDLNYYYMYSGSERTPECLKHVKVTIVPHQTPNFGYRSSNRQVVQTSTGFQFIALNKQLQKLSERINCVNQSFINF